VIIWDIKMTDNKDNEWQNKNYSSITRRLQWLADEKDGILYNEKLSNHIRIDKNGDMIIMRFLDMNMNSKGTMAEMDLKSPLNLLIGSPLTMMLSLIWQREPKNIHLVGFGAGRIPLVLHHYFPALTIESTEIDPIVPELAEKYFGLQFDSRQKVVIEDGREYLTKRLGEHLYNIIMIDAFPVNDYMPYHLSTIEFYNVCKKNLFIDGVLAINVVESDPLYLQRINTLKNCFKNVYMSVHKKGKVAFGTDADYLTDEEIIKRIKEIQKQYPFILPLLPTGYLKPLSEYFDYLAQFGNSIAILQDDFH